MTDHDARRNLPESSIPIATRHWAPIVSLLLLAPVIGEVLVGATRITTLFDLVPRIGTWGSAALLIREVVRRHGGAGTRRRDWLCASAACSPVFGC